MFACEFLFAGRWILLPGDPKNGGNEQGLYPARDKAHWALIMWRQQNDIPTDKTESFLRVVEV